ncbi:MAG: ABC transporter ATP-binding protein [Fidelibacterota bacterium]
MSIILDRVKYSYGSQFSLNINRQIPENSITILIGENGAGKTTLLKLLAGVLVPDSGKIIFDYDNPDIGYIFQNPDDQLIQLSIEKELAFNLENQGMKQEKMAEIINTYLDEYDFQGRAKISPGYLSGGEKQRLALASTLISKPQLLIFDEPTGFLDYKQREKFYCRVKQLKAGGHTIIWATHEIDELFFADYLLELKAGQTRFWGSNTDFLKHLENNPEMRELLYPCD